MAARTARRPLVAGNWKMNLTHLEAIALVQKVAFSLTADQLRAVEVVVLPSFVSLRSVQTLVDGDKLLVGYGGQDLSPHESGAYTGDVSGPMLARLGCGYVIVGHSERREFHHEDDALVNAKLGAAFRAGLTPIMCLGEGSAVRESGEHVSHCVRQLRAALDGVSAQSAAAVVVAYEPIWAIGTGRTATPQDAQQIGAALREALADMYGPDLAAGVRILYGGSVKASTAGGILAEPDIDGALVGGASLDGDEFAVICRIAGGEQPS